MTSTLQLKSNRANAQQSTGPRSEAGKARSARNAVKHGLSAPVATDDGTARQITNLARSLVGDPALRFADLDLCPAGRGGGT